MAKKKSKNKGQQAAMSPNRYMRDKARTLPIGKCYISPEWQKTGLAHIVVTRQRPSGNIVMGAFLVDTFCLGVKDADFNANLSASEFDDYLQKMGVYLGIEEIGYNEAHNIIYGAIAFAEEGGISPSKEFQLAQYALEEDTEEVPLIEYEFGRNGKHFLVINANGSEKRYLDILKRNLGDDFDFVEEVDESDEDAFDDMCDFTEEKYSYQYPDYPQSVNVKNGFIADELLSHANHACLPREVIDRILALPCDEAAQDISNIVLYEIGRTYKVINDDTIGDIENGAILHALLLLAQLGSDKGLDAVLEISRQNALFEEYHLGDFGPELIPPALYACGKDKISGIEDYLYAPGFSSYLRANALDALMRVAVNHPERRGEIIDVFRRLLVSMVSRLPKREACDGALAGFFMCNLVDINARELIPEIKAVFETGCVDESIAGDCKAVVDDIEKGRNTISKKECEIPDIYVESARIGDFFK